MRPRRKRCRGTAGTRRSGTFAKAVALDPNFGLGYAGMAIASRNLDKQQDAEKYIKEAVRHLDSMTERERYRTRGLFYYLTSDYQQCVKEYGELIARYAADAPARNNLALCLTHLRSMPRALDEMRQVVKILPKRALYRVNLALYAAYSGDAQTAATRSARAAPDRRVRPAGAGVLTDASGAAATGRRHLPALEGHRRTGRLLRGVGSWRSRAVRRASRGRRADSDRRRRRRPRRQGNRQGRQQVCRARLHAGAAAAETRPRSRRPISALAKSHAAKIRLLAARVFIDAGALAKAQALADALASELQAEPQAYGKISTGEIALKGGDPRQAIKVADRGERHARHVAGTLRISGVRYLEAGAFTQADSEFDRCISRRGEALALFLDEEPTFGQFPPVYYYQGRVREGLNTAGYMESYRTYLAIRGQSKDDPLLADARRRAAR